jgi:hypothetical protein
MRNGWEDEFLEEHQIAEYRKQAFSGKMYMRLEEVNRGHNGQESGCRAKKGRRFI